MSKYSITFDLEENYLEDFYIFIIYKMSKSTSYCLTINNYTLEQYESLKNEKHDYIIIGKEVGESGTPHLQAYIYMKSMIGFNGLKKRNPTAHIEKCKGTPLQNKTYCSKDGDFWEDGNLPIQGKRTDLEVAKTVLQETGKIRDVVAQATSIQAVKSAECIIKYIENKRDWKPKVLWLFGTSGCGKTRKAHDIFSGEDIYRKSNSTGQWWDGYDAHAFVIIDDIKDTTMPYYLGLLELLDRYECRVQFKGGSRQFLAKEIILTSIWHPFDLYKDYENATEILRRIDTIECVKTPI